MDLDINLDGIVPDSFQDEPEKPVKRESPIFLEDLNDIKQQSKSRGVIMPSNIAKTHKISPSKLNPNMNSQDYQDRFKRIYQSTANKPFQNQNGMIDRKRKMGFTDDELYLLQMDLKSQRYTKKQLMMKYSISESTINRYVRKFNDLTNEKKKYPPYPQEFAKNIKNKRNMLKTPQDKVPQLLAPSKAKELSKDSDSIVSQTSYPPGYEPFVSRKKHSKVRLIQAKLLQLFKLYPQIYQNQAAAMLSKHFKQDISVHVVSRCMRNISVRQKELSQSHIPQSSEPLIKGYFGNLQQNSNENIENRFTFARQFMNLKQKNVVYTYLDIFTKIQRGKQEKIHFALSMSGAGKIIHWKLKNFHFKSEEISKFILQINMQMKGCTVLLDDIRINRQLPIIQLLKNKNISYLYLPPFSPHLNPIKRVFGFIAEDFRNKLKGQMQPQETLRLAHATILQAKDRVYLKEVEFARHYIDVAYRKEPFPFDRVPQF